MLPGAGGTVPGDDDSWCKENDTAGDSTGTEAEKKSFPRPSIVRKRSYSFSDGHLKHPTLPPVKGWNIKGGSLVVLGEDVDLVLGRVAVEVFTLCILDLQAPKTSYLNCNINDPLNLKQPER